jgi:hypothetical protein
VAQNAVGVECLRLASGGAQPSLWLTRCHPGPSIIDRSIERPSTLAQLRRPALADVDAAGYADPAEAVGHHARALATYEALVGRAHAGTATCAYYLAAALRRAGDHERAAVRRERHLCGGLGRRARGVLGSAPQPLSLSLSLSLSLFPFHSDGGPRCWSVRRRWPLRAVTAGGHCCKSRRRRGAAERARHPRSCHGCSGRAWRR